MSSRTMPDSLSSPTRSTSTSSFRIRRSIKPSVSATGAGPPHRPHCQLFGLIRPSSCPTLLTRTSISPHWCTQSITTPRTPIQLIQHGSSAGKIVLWHRAQRQQHLALPTEADSGRLQIESLRRGAGKCFPLFQCVFSPLQIAKEALPQINAVLEIGLQAANHIHPSLAVLIRTIESALIFLPCRL